MIDLHYDTQGYAKLGNCWIRRPLLDEGEWLVIEGAHPHDPEGRPNKHHGRFADESRAVEKAQEAYRSYLMAELDKLPS